MAIVFANFSKKRVESQTLEWLHIDESSNTGGHLVTKFSSLMPLVHSKRDTKAIALYTVTGLKKTYSARHFEPSFDDKIDFSQYNFGQVETERHGFNKFQTFVKVSDGSENYIVSFMFLCDDFFAFYLIFILISLFTLTVNFLMDRDMRMEMKQDFLSSYVGILHEITSQFNRGYRIIDLISGQLNKGLNQDKELEELVQKFTRARPLVDNMRNDMLNIMNEITIESPEEVDINSVYKMFRHSYTDSLHSITISEQLTSNGKVKGSFSGLLSIVSNLASNGFKYSEGPRVVIFKSWDDPIGNKVMFSVSSTGPSLSWFVRKKIMKAFYRYSEKKGTGLGLWIASRYAKAHGGTINATSKDGFNTFTVELPAAASAKKLSKIAPVSTEHKEIVFKKGSRISVGIIDDDDSARLYVKSNLKELKCTDYYFESTQDFVDAVRSGFDTEFDLLVVDRFIEGGRDILETNFLSDLRTKYHYYGPICLFSAAIPNKKDLPDSVNWAVSKSSTFHFIKIV